MRVGFVGNLSGLTSAQKEALICWVAENDFEITEFHHGDNVGADDQADTIVREFALAFCRIIVHPANSNSVRAFTSDKDWPYDKPEIVVETRRKRPPILRNCEIVEQVDMMIVAPKTREPINHSCTWFAYGYAVKHKVRAILIYPNGRLVE